MRFPYPSLLALLLAPALFLLTARPGHALRPDIIYTPRDGFLQVTPMRALTLNAHVSAFQYDPLGLEIAYVGSETEGGTTTHFVKLVDARHGHEMDRLSLTVPATPEEGFGFQLVGWSSSGRYLMLERFLPAPEDETSPGKMPAAIHDYLRWDVSANPPALRVFSPEGLLPEGAKALFDVPYLSPSGQWLAWRQIYDIDEPEQQDTQSRYQISLYDSEKDTTRVLTLPHGLHFWGWRDERHLRFTENGSNKEKSYDVLTDTLQDAVNSPGAASPQTSSRQYPDLKLDVEYRPQKDVQQGSDGQIASHILWIRRFPKSKTPLGVAAAGLTPGEDDPQAVWSPTGKQIAFVAHGELCVTDIAAPTEPVPEEKLAVNLPLTCAEEQGLAVSRLKQIGLALILFAQDNNENYPPAEDIQGTLYPYLKTMSVFQIGAYPFVYDPPAELSLPKMESPGTMEMGYMNLPCARVILFADGHARVFPKSEAAIKSLA